MKASHIAMVVFAGALIASGCRSTVERLADFKAQLQRGDTNPYYYARRIAELGDPGVKWLLADTSGTYDGDWEEVVGIALRYAPCDVLSYLTPCFTNADARSRGFAARVAGHTLNKRFVPYLEKMRNDPSPMPDGWLDRTVGECALAAIRALNYASESPEEHRRAQELTEQTASKP